VNIGYSFLQMKNEINIVVQLNMLYLEKEDGKPLIKLDPGSDSNSAKIFSV